MCSILAVLSVQTATKRDGGCRTSRAAPVEINMLGWYGTAEADMVAEFEAANNVKFKPKYYAGGDNMLAALAQNPPGTFDLIHTDAEYASLLIESNLVDELNPADYPMDDLMHEDFGKFPGHWKDGKLRSAYDRCDGKWSQARVNASLAHT